MAYSEKARAMRRCTALKADGTRCRAWAMWGHPEQRCCAHGGHTRGKAKNLFWGPRTVVVCKCSAYAFPHRPGGGLCEWPDHPRWVSTMKAGTRGFLHGMYATVRKHGCIADREKVVRYAPLPGATAESRESEGTP